jgi:sec-independent protein translocase protein TatC
MAFAYFLVFPGVFQFLVSITPQGVEMMTDIGKYVSFAMTMFISFGIAFEVPIVVILLVLTGMVKVEKLTKSRGYVVIGIFIVSAIITPTTDAISQLAMAGPMWLLYEGGVIAARLMTRNRPKEEEDKAEQSA